MVLVQFLHNCDPFHVMHMDMNVMSTKEESKITGKVSLLSREFHESERTD